MSDYGALIDALVAIVRTAVPDLPTGTKGYTRGPGLGQEKELVPHLFASEPLRARTKLNHRQFDVTLTVGLELWVRNETQEELSARADAVVAGIHGDPTLSGLVRDCHVERDWLREFPGVNERVAIFVVEAQRFE